MVLTDPREVLEGLNIIINGYNAKVTGVPNIINVFGYMENKSYGSSKADETGMPWKNIADTVQLLTSLDPADDFGGPILYRGTRFAVDLKNLPPLPIDYRVGGDTNISLLDFISEVCDAASCDFFFELVKGIVWGIKVYTISRKNPATLGKITEFIQSNPEFISSEVGIENVNAETGKFLIGGQKHEMYYQPRDGIDANAYVWPYWGVDNNQDVILGTGVNNEHKFTVDSSMLNVPGMDKTYTMNVNELRAASDARHSWELFLLCFDNKPGPHYQKATRLGLVSSAHALSLIKSFETDTVYTPVQYLRGPETSTDALLEQEYNIQQVYEFVKNYADQYYGKQFMVRTSFVKSKRDDTTKVITTSHKPIDSAFISEEDWPTAIAKNLLPLNVDAMSNDEGKISAYVKFDRAEELDFSELGPDDIVLSSNGKTAFVKCSVEPDIVYINYQGMTSPRAVVTLPAPVRDLKDNSNNYASIIQMIKDEHYPDSTITAAQLTSQVGGDALYAGQRGIAVLPNAVSLPLESQKNYGPWVSYGAQGKITFEKDDSLVPWNFGGDYATMNLVANSRVNETAANLTVMESGSIEYPGSPTFSFGQQLIAAGPYITNINTTVGSDGMKTTYRMEVWTPRYGKLSKSYTDRAVKVAQTQNAIRRRLRGRVSAKIAANQNRYLSIRKSRAVAANSTHPIIAGSVISEEYKYKTTETDENGDDIEIENTKTVYKQSIAMIPHYGMDTNLGQDYKEKGGMSLDGLFRVFSTDSGNTKMPHFEYNNTSGITDINSRALNPFKETDIQYVVTGEEPKKEIKCSDVEPYNSRGIALRGPLVVAGWGYDTEGLPTPSGGNQDFLPGYTHDTAKWKCGPVDLRWDDNNKVWAAGGGDNMRIAVAKSFIKSPFIEKIPVLYDPSSPSYPNVAFYKYKLSATSGLCFIYKNVNDLIKGSVTSTDYVTNIDTSKYITEGNVLIVFKQGGTYIPAYIGN